LYQAIDHLHRSVIVQEVGPCVLTAQMRPPQPLGIATTDHRTAPKTCAVNRLQNRQRDPGRVANKDEIKHRITFPRRSNYERRRLVKQ
jgi:hypothetical protein